MLTTGTSGSFRGEHSWRTCSSTWLDAQSALFVVTLEAGRAVLVAYLEGATANRLGDAAVCDDDITHLLPRLGCVGPEDLPAWADLPRVLPPGDVDLLLARPPPAEITRRASMLGEEHS
jgi:hypothetical protein